MKTCLSSVDRSETKRGLNAIAPAVPKLSHSVGGDQAKIQRKPHCACGGGCPRCQAKHASSALTTDTPGDKYEQEADHVADAVMGVSDSDVRLSRQPDLKVSRYSHDGGDAEVPPDVHGVLNSPGQPLDAGARDFMEPRFRRDFSDVRLHTGAAAEQSAQALNALAYTVGNHVVLGAEQHQPSTAQGRRLLAHELTHVVQQGSGSPGADSATRRSKVQRLVRTSSVTCPAAATGIANPHTGSADRRASSLLDTAITRITNAQAVRAASPADADVVGVGTALNTVFHLDPANNDTWTMPAPNVRLPVILRRLQAAKSYIDSVVFTVHCISNGGAGYTIPGCANSTCAAGTEAFSCHANPVEIVLCPDFWALGVDQRGRTWMHEVMHIMFQFINDWGQPNVHNAHCYAQFVALLNGFNSPAGFRCP